MIYDNNDKDVGMCIICYEKTFNLTFCRTFKHTLCHNCFYKCIDNIS